MACLCNGSAEGCFGSLTTTGTDDNGRGDTTVGAVERGCICRLLGVYSSSDYDNTNVLLLDYDYTRLRRWCVISMFFGSVNKH